MRVLQPFPPPFNPSPHQDSPYSICMLLWTGNFSLRHLVGTLTFRQGKIHKCVGFCDSCLLSCRLHIFFKIFPVRRIFCDEETQTRPWDGLTFHDSCVTQILQNNTAPPHFILFFEKKAGDEQNCILIYI